MVDIVKRGRLGDDADEGEGSSASRFERRWFEPHLAIDRAHVVMLAECEILPEDTAARILDTLAAIAEAGFEELPVRSDLHVSIEEAVIDELGEDVGGRMHTGRSRNDKGSTAFRMIAREELLELCEELLVLQSVLLDRATETADWPVSGYTHLQNAQPTTLGHHLLAHQQAISRDVDRLLDAYARVNLNPLGSAAFGGTGWDIDRDRTTELLGFDAPIRNSMDGVASRDFVPESIAAAANATTNVSRLCEDLVLWSTNEFGFAELADRHAGSSSIMPQKKNPIAAELVRSKAGTVSGATAAAFATLESLPMSQNMDLLNEPADQLTGAFGTAHEGVRTITDVVEGVSFDREAMADSAGRGFTTATELADTLVRETGIAFRTAHHIVARLARDHDPEAITPGTVDDVAREVTGEGLDVDEAVLERALDPRRNIEIRDSFGGPGEVDTALRDAERRLQQQRDRLGSKTDALRGAERELEAVIDAVSSEQ